MTPTELDHLSTWQLSRRLLRDTKGYRLHLLGVLALGVLATPLALLQPLPMKIVVDSVLGTQPLPNAIAPFWPDWASSGGTLLVATALFFVALQVVSQLRSHVSGYVQSYTGQRLGQSLRNKVFHHVQTLSLAYHDRSGSSDSTYRLQSDAVAIQQVFLGAAIPVLTSIAPLFGIVVVTYLIDPPLTLLALGALPLHFLLIRFFGARLRHRWKAVKQLDSAATAVVQEVLSTLRVVKAFGQEDQEQERFVRASDQRIGKQLDAVSFNALYHLLVGLVITATTAAVLYTGTLHVQSGRLSLGELLMIMAYIGQIFGPMRTMTSTASTLSNALASAERVYQVLDQPPEVDQSRSLRPLVRARGAVEYDRVTFAYEDGSRVLDEVSFRVEPGTRVGIQGPTGAGKTTLIGLMMRFYDPQSGSIRLDGTDVRELRLRDLRNQFAIVLQDPVLFARSIAENIAYGRPGASRDEIAAAARQANAHDFISALPDGYDSRVGERGMTLSGGERQRVALARAFLKNAPILILDEPTSALDRKTEAAVMDAIERLMVGRTTFIIAHRDWTLERCDVLFKLEGGSLHSAAGMTERAIAS